VELPQGWVNCNLSDVNEIIAGQSPESKYYNENGDGLPFFQGKTDFGHLYPTNRIYCTVPKKLAESGDILLSVRAPVGPTNLSRKTVAIGRGIHAIRPLGDILTSYVLYYFKQIEPVFSGTGTGTTFSAVTVDDVKNLKFPLSPLAEQQRIVKKIDALFSKLDKGVEMLQIIHRQLQTYRQAVLKWAFEEHCTNAPTYQLKTLCTHIVDCLHSTPKWTESGKLCLRTTNFRKGYLDLAEKNYVSLETFNERIRRLKPEKDDVLYSREGAILGLACLIPDNVELCLGQRMMMMRTNDKMSPRFLMHYLNSPMIEIIVKKKTGGTASPHINIRDIKLFEIPTPTLDEQMQIIADIESRLSVCDKLEALVDENLAKANALRQSILKKAFAGQLVPQDPTDEPAEKLLEHIKAERQAATPTSKPARRKKNA